MADDLDDSWWIREDVKAVTPSLLQVSESVHSNTKADMGHTKTSKSRSELKKSAVKNKESHCVELDSKKLKRKHNVSDELDHTDDATQFSAAKKAKKLKSKGLDCHFQSNSTELMKSDVKQRKEKRLEQESLLKGDDADEVIEENCVDEQPVIKEQDKMKKHKRKSISKLLEKRGDIPLVPWDLTSAITTHFKDRLTSVELDEVVLTDEHVALCNDLTFTPSSFLRSLVVHWKKLVKKQLTGSPGSPLIVVICSSGLRAANFIRAIPDFKIDGSKISKLFAKHLKVEDQVKFLENNRTHIGVGTPNRIQVLIENGALHLDHVKYVVLDWSWRDGKYQRLVDIKAVRSDLMTLLAKHLIAVVRTGRVKLALL